MSEITVKYLSEKEILEKKVRSWPTWSCEVSEFPWGIYRTGILLHFRRTSRYYY